MSQSNVERVIGVLVTDEALRHRFETDPIATLQQLAEGGMELTAIEKRCLSTLDPARISRFAEEIDARLQKSDLKRGFSPEGVDQ